MTYGIALVSRTPDAAEYTWHGFKVGAVRLNDKEGAR